MSTTTTGMRWAGALLVTSAVLLGAACGTAGPAAAPPTAAAPAPAGAGVTRVATPGAVFTEPLDAVPASTGDTTWFTATGPGGRGVFALPAGAAQPTPLAVGTPFVAPTGLAVSTDEKTLFVADPQADAVFTVPVAGGKPVELAGSRGLRPRGLEVAGGRLYLTGVDRTAGTGTVFTLPLAGGKPTAVATGLADPDSVTVGNDGSLFVTDRPGSVLHIVNGVQQRLATDVVLGTPAGLALSADSSTLAVSSLRQGPGTAQVLVIDVASGKSTVFDKVIGANVGAGGLHRAHQGDNAAWAGIRGGVYRLCVCDLG